jgi:hypothetical protein
MTNNDKVSSVAVLLRRKFDEQESEAELTEEQISTVHACHVRKSGSWVGVQRARLHFGRDGANSIHLLSLWREDPRVEQICRLSGME